MALLDQIQHPWLTWAGLVLTHSLWQGAAAALFVAILLAVIPRRLAGLRAHGCHLAMLAMLLAPVLTMSVIKPPTTTWHVATPSETSVAETNALPIQPTTITAHAPINETQSTATELDSASIEITTLGQPTTTPISPHPTTAITGQPDNVATAPLPERKWQSTALATMPIAWLCGVSVLTFRLLIGWSRLRRLRQRAATLTEPLEQAAARMLERFGLLGRAVVMTTVDVASPVAFGLFRPVVLVPASLISRCPVEHIEALIAHELAHIRRHDLWFALMQRVVETLFFYHPAVWWISGRTSVERELCCDDLAISTTGQRTVYATALLEASKEVLAAGRPVLTAGIFGSRVTLTERVRRALQLPPQSQNNHSWLVVPLCLAMAGALLLAAHVQANDETKLENTPSVADTTKSMEEADTPANETEERDPVQPMPTTTYLTTEFDKRNEYVDAQLAEDRRLLEQIAPAVAAGQAVHAVRDALYDNDFAKLQRFFRPPGQLVTPEQMEQMRDDFRKMKFEEFGSEWAVLEVDIAPALDIGFIECGQTVLLVPPPGDTADGTSSDPVEMWVHLGAEVAEDNDTGQWYVTRLIMFGNMDIDAAHAQFRDDLLKHHSPDASVQRLFARFDQRTGAVTSYGCKISQLDRTGDLVWSNVHSGLPGARRRSTLLQDHRFLQQRRLDEVAKRIRELEQKKNDSVCLRSPSDGVVTKVLVAVNQNVEEGDLLVELENQETKLQLRAAEIRRDKLRRTLTNKKTPMSDLERDNLESDLELARIDVELWQLRLDRTQIRSPIAGTVIKLERCVRVGNTIEKGTKAVWVLPLQTE